MCRGVGSCSLLQKLSPGISSVDPSGEPYTTLHAYTEPRLDFLVLATAQRTFGVVIAMFDMRSLRAAGGTSVCPCGLVTFNITSVPLVPRNCNIRVHPHPSLPVFHLQRSALRHEASIGKRAYELIVIWPLYSNDQRGRAPKLHPPGPYPSLRSVRAASSGRWVQWRLRNCPPWPDSSPKRTAIVSDNGSSVLGCGFDR